MRKDALFLTLLVMSLTVSPIWAQTRAIPFFNATRPPRTSFTPPNPNRAFTSTSQPNRAFRNPRNVGFLGTGRLFPRLNFNLSWPPRILQFNNQNQNQNQNNNGNN